MPGEHSPSEEEIQAAAKFQTEEGGVDRVEHREGKEVIERLRENAWLIRKEGSRNPVTVAFRRGKELFVTDPGTAAASGGKNRNLEWLKSETETAVGGVMLTHSHPDHIGNLPNMAGEEVPIFVHPKGYWSLRSPKVLIRGERMMTRPDSHPSKLTQVGYEKLGRMLYGPGMKGVKKRTEHNPEGRYLPFPEGPMEFEGYSVEVIPTPGHTRGEVCFWIPEDRILVGGDLVPNTKIGRDNVPSLYMPECNIYDALSSLEKMRDLKPAVFIPAHGEPMWSEDEIETRFSGMIDLLQRFIDRVHEIHTEHPDWKDQQIAKAMFDDPELPKGLHGMRVFGAIERKSIVHSVLRDASKQ